MENEYNILDVIPHDEPMSLLDSIKSHHKTGLTAYVTITENSLLYENGGVPSWVGIEYMGQAIAAFAGVQARENNQPVKIGFLVSTRSYEPGCTHFPLNETLLVSAEQITENLSGLQVFNCSISGTNINIQAKLNVFMPENADAFLKESQS